MLETDGLDLEGSDPVPRRDDHVVRATDVPEVAVLVLHRGILGVKPLAVEGLAPCLLVSPVAERIVRIRARPQTDLAARAALDGLLVVVEELNVPARHRQAHRSFADVEERIVGDERIRLGQAVEVEHGDAVVVAEPADRLRVQRLSRRADAAKRLWIARAGVLDRHHRAHRRRRREHVRHLVAAEKIELLVRVETGFAPVDTLQRSQPPRTEERRDPRRPRPLAHAVKAFAVLHLVAIHEFLVGEDVAVGMHDPLRKTGRPRGVVELRWVVGRRRFADAVGRRARERALFDQKHLCRGVPEARRVRSVGDDDLRLRVREPVLDRLVPVEHRHREQDGAELPGAEEDRGGLGCRR